MSTDENPLKRDHQGVPTAKIVFWGPTMAGKTTALTIIKVLKTLEDPANVYKFLKLEDPTGRTLFFDQAIFGVGRDGKTGLPFLKYHVYTVPGQTRHAGQRKVVLRGAHGLVIVVDSEKSRWEENKASLVEIIELAGDKLSSGKLPYFILLNKMDLDSNIRIDVQEVMKMLVEAGAQDNMKGAAARILPVSCITGSRDLKKLLATPDRSSIIDDKGQLKRGVRPKSVDRIIKPVEGLIREIIVSQLS